jgi:hypothetical protein
MLRYSLATLLVATTAISVACAALVKANENWRQITQILTLAILCFAVVAAIVRRGRSQVFALGFAVFGWVFFLLIFIPAFGLADDLVPTRAVNWLGSAIHEKEVETRIQYGNPYPTLIPVRYPIPDEYYNIARDLWVLLVAALGGAMAQIPAIGRRNTRRE